ncbi:hypothetical protein N7472_000924 [Penicillium cf. griseofulvum]|uniref:Uncharacterized protein n=1 Tax=Penicillium cf. griseofulvum TaxID=2972120 RepID=A0A9W9T6X1_9EURO|nr:hypothetical protein N7472_000924 [Penicillium cf. griseofulvum]
MASNGSVFWFLKISNDSKWSEHVVTARDNHFEHPLGLLVHIFRRADLISPTHSKESSIQSYDREETNGAAGALAIDEDVEIQAALTSQNLLHVKISSPEDGAAVGALATEVTLELAHMGPNTPNEITFFSGSGIRAEDKGKTANFA